MMVIKKMIYRGLSRFLIPIIDKKNEEKDRQQGSERSC